MLSYASLGRKGIAMADGLVSALVSFNIKLTLTTNKRLLCISK